jgi:hypothetical protein
MREIIIAEKKFQGWPMSDAEVLRIFEIDAVLNADGLEPWLDGLPA